MPGILDLQLAPGALVQFFYPRHNVRGHRSRMELRRVQVRRVRDLRDDPLDPETRSIAPLTARGTVLVTGLDLDRGEERSFYVESMAEPRPLDCRPRPLTPLWMAIIQDGRLIDVAEQPDPREAFVEHFNEQAGRFGLTAVA